MSYRNFLRSGAYFRRIPNKINVVVTSNFQALYFRTLILKRNFVISSFNKALARPSSEGNDWKGSNDARSEGNRHGYLLYLLPVALVAGALHIMGYAGDTLKAHADSGESNSKRCVEGTNRRRKANIDSAVKEARTLVTRFKTETLCPGMTIAVTVDGIPVWKEGIGLADVENDVPCSPDTVMRIASISKPLTMTVIARLWEEGKLDLDASIQKYVPSWPDKYFDGKKVTVTTRQLVSMIGGVRHYEKDCGKKRKEEIDKKHDEKKHDNKSSKDGDEKKASEDEEKTKKKEQGVYEFSCKEFYIRKHYKTVTEALRIFKDDPLCSLPGTEYLYTTHGYTLLSAVVEGAAGKQFPDVMKQLFLDLGLEHTYLELAEPLIFNRSRYYQIDKKKHLINTPYVDNSYKWAGGGLISTATDLCRFGNAMLYSYQTPKPCPCQGHCEKKKGSEESAEKAASAADVEKGCCCKDNRPQGYLSSETMHRIWQPVVKIRKTSDDSFYAMGWGFTPDKEHPPYCRDQRMYIVHTGGAVGASSVILILPAKSDGSVEKRGVVRGVVVSIIVNMQSIGMQALALEVAKIFERVRLETDCVPDGSTNEHSCKVGNSDPQKVVGQLKSEGKCCSSNLPSTAKQ